MAKVIDRDRGWEAFKQVLKESGDLVLVVGIAGDANESIATYASANEYGTRTIPSRPAWRTTFDQNRAKYSDAVNQAYARAIAGRSGTARNELLKVGIGVRNDLIDAIIGWTDPPNALSTQIAKGGSKGPVNNPLVDTGAMQRAIAFEVRAREAVE